jgi:CHAT domain-containing protein/tetratricopeptide (TPR) repeat protein
MWQVRGWMTLVVVCGALGAAAGEPPPPDARLQEAQTDFDEANKAWEAGQYAESIKHGEYALELREAVLGATHPEVARCLQILGLHHLLRGESTQAEPLLVRALAIREATLGKNHPDVAQTLNTLANLYWDQRLYPRAEPLLQRAMAIREAAFGKHHPLVAEVLTTLAQIYEDQELYARAESLLVRALAIQETAFGKNHPEAAQPLTTLAQIYQLQGLYARAEPLFVRALAIREAALGENHPLVAELLGRRANLYAVQGLSTRAEPLLARALTIQERALGNNPPDIADALWKLAEIYQYQGLYARAEPLLVRALAIRETALGKSHPLVADLLCRLARSYQDQGLYGRAELLYKRALAIRETSLGENHSLVVDVLDSLGTLYMAQGSYARAEPLYERELAIVRASFGDNSPDAAFALFSLARLYVAQGMYARAEPLVQRALGNVEKAWGKKFPYVADALEDLGHIYQAQGLYRRAAPLLERALAIMEKARGKNHPNVASLLNSRADLYSAQGLYGQAEPLLQRALVIQEAALGNNHPSVAGTLNHLAVVRLAQHHVAEAVPLFTRAFAISEHRLRQEALGFSEERLASFLQFLRTDEERLYALLRAYPDDGQVRRLALSAALLLKGRSVEESAAVSQTIHRSLSAEERDTFERLGGLRTQLAQLSLQGPGSLPLPVYQQQLKELARQGDALEADLAQRSAPLREQTELPPPAEIVDRVAAALPKEGALVEFISYADRPLVLKPGESESQHLSEQRYLALVLFPDATIRVQDLGPAEPIDSAALHLRDALANRDAAFQPLAQGLYQLAFQPLLPLLGETHRLFLSPDGQLDLVPFAALHDGHQFLVDTFDFTYLPSGRSLLPRPLESRPPGSVVVLSDPDFNASLKADPASQREALAQAERSSPGERFFSALRADLAHRAWAPIPLPGTRQEAQAIQRLLPQAQLFLGPEATKERLLHLPTPGILHLATHGFFLEDAPEPKDSRSVHHFGAMSDEPLAPRPADPLLRSGLVFAGANTQAPSGSSLASSSLESSLVTALELAGLNLWGTQLVVLSACDTGRGDVKVGQGVYGLRRAFLVSGTETVVMSLWKVEDETTSRLMQAYYRNLMVGQGRAEALREAMRSVRQSQPHPHYWAPFIAMGRDTPLRLLAISSQDAQHR